MPLTLPGPLRYILLTLSLAAAGLASAYVLDEIERAEPDYAPLVVASALEDWRAPWPEEPAAGGAAGVECGPLPRRWLVLGWDAASWSLLLPLVEAGRLPNLAALMSSGAYGPLYSFLPSLSPALWTTVATGLPPDRHGIHGFYDRKPRLARWMERARHWGRLERQLYSSVGRRVPAAWNLLSDRGRRVLVAGYHNTFPVEPIDGLMVSNYLVQEAMADAMSMEAGAGDSPAGGLVYPPAALPEVLALQRAVMADAPAALAGLVDLADGERSRFLAAARTLPGEGDQRPYFVLHAWMYDTVIARVAERFLTAVAPDASFVHFQGLDWLAHRLLSFHDPDAFAAMPWTQRERADWRRSLPVYRRTLDAFCADLDGWLGRLATLAGPGAAVMLLSDHGVGPGPDPRLPGYHDDAPPGILVLAGPGIRRGARLAGASLYDILPTLMASLGEPVARDLPGRPLAEAFCPGAWEERRVLEVASYGGRVAPAPGTARPEDVRRSVLEELEALGYLD